MLQHTRGIVFQQFKYSESSLIVKIYTEHYGLQSYIVKGVRSKRSKIRPAFFQPLNLLDLVVYHKEGKSLNHISEVKIAFPFQSIPVDYTKRSMLFFLNELVYRSIREEIPNLSLFEWLFQAITWLELSDDNIVNYHLIFMLQLSRFLGFYPKKSTEKQTEFFDLQEGLFVNRMPDHPHFIKGKNVDLLEKLQESTFEMSSKIEMGNSARRLLLESLVSYYRLHLPGFGEMKSLEVLKSVME
jgi:DNA repair protein RecO (recombination protein O)